MAKTSRPMRGRERSALISDNHASYELCRAITAHVTLKLRWCPGFEKNPNSGTQGEMRNCSSIRDIKTVWYRVCKGPSQALTKCHR